MEDIRRYALRTSLQTRDKDVISKMRSLERRSRFQAWLMTSSMRSRGSIKAAVMGAEVSGSKEWKSGKVTTDSGLYLVVHSPFVLYIPQEKCNILGLPKLGCFPNYCK